MGSPSENNTPLGGLLGVVGFVSGFSIAWQQSDKNLFVALLIGSLVGAIGARIGSFIWRVLVVLVSLAISLGCYYVRHEVIAHVLRSDHDRTEMSQEVEHRDLSRSYIEAPSVKKLGREVYVQNDCSRPVALVINYLGVDSEWHTGGWWSVAGEKGTYLLTSDNSRLSVSNPGVFYYAEIPGTGYSWEGTMEIHFRGRRLLMGMVNLSKSANGDYTLRLGCDNYNAPAPRIEETEASPKISGRAVFFKNKCPLAVKLVFRYQALDEKWHTDGWWSISGKGEGYLSVKKNIKLQSTSAAAYYYAEVPGTSLEWPGPIKSTFKDRTLEMRSITLSINDAGQYVFGINCEGYVEIDARDKAPMLPLLDDDYRLGLNGENIEFFIYKDQVYRHGIKVYSLVEGSPAESAGILPGDVVYSVDRHKLESFEALRSYINEREGSAIVLGFLRKGSPRSVEVTPVRNKSKEEEYLLGLGRTINLGSFAYNGRLYKYGVGVYSLQAGMPAEAAGLTPGDILYSVDGSTITSMDFLQDYVNRQRGRSVVIGFIRKGYARTTEVMPEKRLR